MDVFSKVRWGGEINSWDIMYTAMRVGYAGDSLYMFNTYLADFILPSTNQSQSVYFNNALK
jgi:hypothetical protein